MDKNTDDLKKLIEKEYKFKGVQLTFLRESSDNIVYYVDFKLEHMGVLRLSKRDVSQDILFELKWIDALSKSPVPVAPIIRTNNGKLYFQIEKTVGVVFEFMKGFHLDLSNKSKIDVKYIKEGAKALAKLHNISSAIAINIPRKRNIFTELNRILVIKKEFEDRFGGGKEFTKLIEEYITWAKSQTYKPVLINNDYRIGNVIFKNNGIEAIIDFDWACIGPAQKDLALALVEWSYVDKTDNGPNKKIFETFLSEYNKIAKVKFTKNETLFKWICFSCLSDTSTYLIDRINQEKPNKVTDSYMYQKHLYFSNYIKNQ